MVDQRADRGAEQAGRCCACAAPRRSCRAGRARCGWRRGCGRRAPTTTMPSISVPMNSARLWKCSRSRVAEVVGQPVVLDHARRHAHQPHRVLVVRALVAGHVEHAQHVAARIEDRRGRAGEEAVGVHEVLVGMHERRAPRSNSAVPMRVGALALLGPVDAGRQRDLRRARGSRRRRPNAGSCRARRSARPCSRVWTICSNSISITGAACMYRRWLRSRATRGRRASAVRSRGARRATGRAPRSAGATARSARRGGLPHGGSADGVGPGPGLRDQARWVADIVVSPLLLPKQAVSVEAARRSCRSVHVCMDCRLDAGCRGLLRRLACRGSCVADRACLRIGRRLTGEPRRTVLSSSATPARGTGFADGPHLPFQP